MINATSLPTHFESLYPADTRADEIQQLLTFVQEGNAAQLIALPGVGRGNTLRLLPYNKQVRQKHLGENEKWFHFVLVNFSEVRKRSLLDVTKFLFLSLTDSLKHRGLLDEHKKVMQIFSESLAFQDELILFQGLKSAVDYLSIEKELTLVFLFDRFEEYIPTVSDVFFTNLRTLRDRAKYRFSVIFSLNRPLEELLDPELLSDYYEFVADHTVYLPYYDKPGFEFRLTYLEHQTGKTLNEKTKKELEQITGNHPKLFRIACEIMLNTSNVIARKNDEAISSESDSRSLMSIYDLRGNDKIKDFLLSQKGIQGALFEIWHSLRPEEQKHIIKLHTKNPPTDSHEYLDKSGLLKDNKIQIPLCDEFTKQFSTESIREKLVFDKDTNEIKKGSLSISDQLTALEFRMLSYFLSHAEQTVTRDEVINAVWKDAKSTAGVTDQALDQLILRLRKKIEEDLKEPYHIQTVKGRGFKFFS